MQTSNFPVKLERVLTGRTSEVAVVTVLPDTFLEVLALPQRNRMNKRHEDWDKRDSVAIVCRGVDCLQRHSDRLYRQPIRISEFISGFNQYTKTKNSSVRQKKPIRKCNRKEFTKTTSYLGINLSKDELGKIFRKFYGRT